MVISTLLIDLDDTVYPASSGLWQVISSRIELYLQEKINLPVERISEYRTRLFHAYGTTLRGLVATRNIDEEEYLSFVHDVPLHEYIHPDPLLRDMMINLPYRKFIFTNSDKNHAGRVLRLMEIEDCFAGIIDINMILPYCKPLAESYEIALRVVNESAERCIFIDDSSRNLLGAQKKGIHTIHVNEHGKNGIAPSIRSLLELPAVLSQIIDR